MQELLPEAAEEVRRGLLARRLPFRYFYDAEGSSLFEAITRTPEYYLTRAEAAILESEGPQILARAAPRSVVELGCGSAAKTRILLRGARREDGLAFLGIDVSPAALEAARANLRGLPVEVATREADYDDGFAAARGTQGPRLLLFLGSSIGNYAPAGQEAFLRAARAALEPGDALLLGTDLVKDAGVLRAAYNDAAGHTAAFNRNLLRHLNRAFEGDADPAAFDHEAEWLPDEARVEMRLRAACDQTLSFRALGIRLRLRAGEAFHTEDCHKFTLDGVRALAAACGFRHEAAWMDPSAWYALHLLRVP